MNKIKLAMVVMGVITVSIWYQIYLIGGWYALLKLLFILIVTGVIIYFSERRKR